jgi:large subunit ribosomal protein L24
MKTQFSTSWNASRKPRKQRKFRAKAPLHIKRKLLGAALSKDLRKKHGTKSIAVRKGDTVKIMKGKFKGKQGKIIDINTKYLKVYIEGIQVKKQDGSKANVPVRPSNLQVIELNLSDKKRIKTKKSEEKSQKKEKAKEDTKTQKGNKESKK